MIAVRYLFEVL